MRSAIAVLRTMGERTQFAAAQALRTQFERVEVIQVAPFSEAVRECFRIAIASEMKWLVTVDGDIIVEPDCSKTLSYLAGTMKPNHWQGIGHVEDKLVGGARLGGVRLYRTATLPEMLKHVRDDVIRPEGELCVLNPQYLRYSKVTGKHDYEQWFRDLHRKGAAHRVKHSSWASKIVPKWRASRDPDLQAAAEGWDGKPLSLVEKGPL